MTTKTVDNYLIKERKFRTKFRVGQKVVLRFVGEVTEVRKTVFNVPGRVFYTIESIPGVGEHGLGILARNITEDEIRKVKHG